MITEFKKICCRIFMFYFICLFSLYSTTIQAQYLLGVGDKIKIQVYEEPDLTFEITIDNSGLFSYPYLKQIKLTDKTVAQLEQEISLGLSGKVLKNPNVTVNLVQYRPFSIGGEVTKPGSYPYEPGLTVIKAINLAGGVTEKGSADRFELERIKPVDAGELSSSTIVLPGDTLIVLQRLSINIGGEVKLPGSYPYEPGLTVKRAMNLAGGPTEWSTGKKFKLERVNPIDGEKTTLDSVVSPGDTLTILPRGLFW